MGNCVIFCAADFDFPVVPLTPEDYIIAADGGLRHVNKLGLAPQEILGDFDSLGYIPQGARVFPVRKDDTDSMLAVKRGLSLGFRQFVLYGSLDGPRLDHTIANFQTLEFLCRQGASGYLVGRDYIVTVLSGGRLRFGPQARGILSVFCLGADARGVSLRGLQYPLENGTLTAGFPLGVSNHFTGEAAEISLEAGSLLVIWDRKNGFPEREQAPKPLTAEG